MTRTDATRPTGELLAPFAASARELAVLSDFDGSLAPVVQDPDDAVALPAALDALRRLVPLVRRVGIVSGRAVEFLTLRVALPGVELAGQHGLEFERSGERRLDAAALPYVEVMRVAAAEAESLLPGIRVEDKGASITLHWRGRPARADEVRGVAAELAERHGLVLLPGRLISELRPPVVADKGTAVEALASGCAAAIFAGDDDGDLAGFEALDRLTSSGDLRHALRIGVSSPEAPAELMARADVVVDGPPGLAALLSSLAGIIGGAPD
ncbi:MAG: trehalose-phosphatase [Acidimicrobiia bacterium]|nr:trehalose-phosphatase [Acidimicrobiia bacterium]